jgi:AcrR family transcriptional regulator
MPQASKITTTRPAAKRWSDADHDQRRELITQTALILLQRKGLTAVTMRAVAGKLDLGAMTLYTYIDGQHGLHREMVRRGFEMLNCGCDESSTVGTPEGWRGGSRAYLRFAMDNPNLYKMMFEHFMSDEDKDLLHGGFQHLFDKVKGRLGCEGYEGDNLDRESRKRAGRFWISLHGLAMLAIAGRLIVLEGGLDELLDDLLKHVAPDME